MPKSYRALISVPIAAEDDEEAWDLAAEFARSLLHPRTDIIAGHVELLTETRGGLKPKRVVEEAVGFRDQLGRSGEFLTGLYEQDIENTPFTSAEQARISNQIRQIKAYIENTHNLSSAEVSQVETRLDQAEQASRRIGRKDWLVLFIGAVFSLILTDLITPLTAQHIFLLAVDGISHLFEIEGPK